MATDDDTLKADKEAFEQAEDAEGHNRTAYEEDVRFARLEEQWPAEIQTQREKDHRPCLTISMLGAMIKNVVNDARQNKPSIKVHPVDDGADKETADIFSGLIRNIEAVSRADIAYDWATECAVSGGFGYLRVVDEYSHDDTFDMDLRIKRVLDPLSVYGDPHSTSSDGSDWNSAFVVERMKKDDFKAKYKGADPINWDATTQEMAGEWFTEEEVLVAERWIREEIDKPICLLSDGTIVNKEDLEEQTDGMPYAEFLQLQGVTIERERTAKSWKVTQRILTGAEIIAEKTDYKGKFIPLVPVYGEEIFIDGKRYFRSLIRSAKDAQRQYNYWETNATEMAALQPKVPFIGKKGSFKSFLDKWSTANIRSWPYIEYDGDIPPQRQPIDMGPAAASLAEAARASENIKKTVGMYGDAVRQTQSPESGRALNARQREEDTGTFHFSDNMARAIRQVGAILIDLAPHYYNQERIIRVMGEDGTPDMVPIKQPAPVKGPDGQPMMQPGPMQMDGQPGPPIPMTRIYDLASGKYDLIVKTGPSYPTRREEAATQMVEMVRAYPDLMPVVGDLIAKHLDWPGAEEIAKRLEGMVPDKAKGGLPPEVQKMMKDAEEKFKAIEAENASLKLAAQAAKSDQQVKVGEMQIKAEEVKIDEFRARTERMKVVHEITKPPEPIRTNGPRPSA